MGYVQSQYAPSSYIGLWTRLAGFERAQLTRALERRTVVQGTLMRGTIHIVSARDYWPWRPASARTATRGGCAPDARSPSARSVAVADGCESCSPTALAGGRSSSAELGVDSTTWNGVGGWVDLLRVPPSGTWERRSADLYGVAEDWLQGSPDATQDEGLELLVRRYLGGFGPASAQGHRELGGRLASTRSRRRLNGCGSDGSATSTVESSWICRARRSRVPTFRHPSGSCPRGMPRCSCTRDARGSCPRTSVRSCSTRRPRIRSRRS